MASELRLLPASPNIYVLIKGFKSEETNSNIEKAEVD